MKLDLDLCRIEELALEKDTAIHQWAAKLVLRVRQLEHELADPNYMYGGRICRQAIICRNVEIDQLRKELKEKDARIAELKKQLENTYPKDLHDRS